MRRLAADRSGQALIEYGLVLGLIAMVAIGALLLVGGNVNSSLNESGKSLQNSPVFAPLPSFTIPK